MKKRIKGFLATLIVATLSSFAIVQTAAINALPMDLTDGAGRIANAVSKQIEGVVKAILPVVSLILAVATITVLIVTLVKNNKQNMNNMSWVPFGVTAAALIISLLGWGLITAINS